MYDEKSKMDMVLSIWLIRPGLNLIRTGNPFTSRIETQIRNSKCRSLDALLLGELSKEGEDDARRYHSHSHLVVRERAAALPHLPRFRLAQVSPQTLDLPPYYTIDPNLPTLNPEP